MADHIRNAKRMRQQIDDELIGRQSADDRDRRLSLLRKEHMHNKQSTSIMNADRWTEPIAVLVIVCSRERAIDNHLQKLIKYLFANCNTITIMIDIVRRLNDFQLSSVKIVIVNRSRMSFNSSGIIYPILRWVEFDRWVTSQMAREQPSRLMQTRFFESPRIYLIFSTSAVTYRNCQLHQITNNIHNTISSHVTIVSHSHTYSTHSTTHRLLSPKVNSDHRK